MTLVTRKSPENRSTKRTKLLYTPTVYMLQPNLYHMDIRIQFMNFFRQSIVYGGARAGYSCTEYTSGITLYIPGTKTHLTPHLTSRWKIQLGKYDGKTNTMETKLSLSQFSRK